MVAAPAQAGELAPARQVEPGNGLPRVVFALDGPAR